MMTMSRRWLMIGYVAAMSATSACFRTSASPKDATMRNLQGDNVSLYYGGGVGLEAELLAVTDSSFIVMRPRTWSHSEGWDGRTTLQTLNPSGVTVVPRRSIRRIEFGLTGFDTPDGKLKSFDLEKVVHHSRYPYGLSADAMADLLRATGQTKPDTIRPASR
jgi:hypothetical protein